MEGENIAKHLPGIHAVLLENNQNSEVLSIHEKDLEDLSWLSPLISYSDYLKGIISILDRYYVALISSEDHPSTLKIPRVRIFTYDCLYKILMNKEKLKEVCARLKEFLLNMELFRRHSELIGKSQDSIEFTMKKLHQNFKSFRYEFTAIFQQLEKYIESEHSKSIGNFLDDLYFTESLQANKEILKSKIESHNLYRQYKSAQYQNIKHSFYSSNKYDDIYVGETCQNMKHGYGKLYYSNRNVYEGYWKNDKKHGKGIFLWKDGSKYCGDFMAGVFHGSGRKVYSNGSFYDGEFVKGKKCGKGFMKFRNGDSYEGQWDDDDMHGKGVYRWNTGDVFEGSFSRDKRDGQGVLTLSTGEVIQGTWSNGVKKEDKIKDED